LCRLDPDLKTYLTRVKALPTEPTLNWYRENLGEIVRLLQRAGVQVVLLSLPMIGEDPESEAGRCSQTYSQVVKAVAEAESAGYLPLNEKQIEYLAARETHTEGEQVEAWQRIAHTAIQYYL